ncbi:MFS transporter [Orbus wheelerorum]|uniref:MFS transporter n=1 Tax=Orbus wheelerorum TaxID=3074111 RepID=UPI00370D5C09
MPFVIFIFSLCTFSIGFTEFVTIGLVANIAQDLNTPVTHAAMAVTIYALGVVIGAPVLTALTTHWSRKQVLVIAMLIFTLGNFAIVFVEQLMFLLVARFFSGLAHGVLLAVTSGVAIRLVPNQKTGSALALVFGGLTIAMSIGVPIGTWLGTLLTWQMIFLVIAGFSSMGVLGLVLFMPSKLDDSTKISITRSGHLKVLLNVKLLAGASVTILAYAGSFTLYSYISPLLLTVTIIKPDELGIIMLTYGIGATIGNVLGGYFTDKWGIYKAVLVVLIMLTSILACIGLLQYDWFLMLLLTALLGLATYAAIPPLQGRLMKLAVLYAPQSLDVVSGMNIASFNTGIVLGSIVGVFTINNLGIIYLAWVGMAISLLAVFALLWQFYSFNQPCRKSRQISSL